MRGVLSSSLDCSLFSLRVRLRASILPAGVIVTAGVFTEPGRRDPNREEATLLRVEVDEFFTTWKQ